jgi:curved DNA-binding protein CbpA
VAKRDPHDVLGVQRGASAVAIKAAWRRLARAHHPDLTGDDPAASRIATRRMAEINDAYAELTRDDGRAGPGRRAGPTPADVGEAERRRGGPPRPKPARPVTGRVDTSQTFRPRNQTTSGAPSPLRGHPPLRQTYRHREELRSSRPNGPLERDRIRDFRPPAAPSIEAAAAFPVEFGKFHGHTLGEIAAFEPSYIDWLARTVQRDPDLAAAARVMKADLDRRGVVRRAHPTPERPARPTWRPGA